ncbi:MAG: hypothetical protein AB8H79_23895 [Myxococcota bacterium]
MTEGARPRWWALGLGVLLVFVLIVGLVWVPRGPSEFAYAPFDLAWPWGMGRGFEVAELLSYGVGLGASLPAVGLLAWGLEPLMPTRVRGVPARWAAVVSAAVAVLSTGALLLVGGRSIVPDELSYAEQARGYVQGYLLVPAPEGLFVEAFDILSPTGGGLASKYLFGEALVQMPGVLVGLPGLLHVPMLLLACWAIWRAATLHGGPGIGALTLSMIGLSPMLLWSSGTGLSHTPAFAAMALAALGEAWALRGRPWMGALMVGLGVGLCGVVRPQVAVPVRGVLCLFTWWHLRKSRPAALLGLVAIPMLTGGLIAVYNVYVTGHPTRLPWSLTGESFGFGFPIPGSGHYHGPWQGLQNVLTNGVRLSVWWMGWPSVLAAVALFATVGRRLGSLRSWVWAGVAELVFLFGYFAPGIYDVGPVYAMECTLGLAAIGACGIAGLYDRRPRLAVSFVVTFLAVAWPTTWMWGGLRLDRLLDRVHEPVQQMLAATPPTQSLVLVETDCLGHLAMGSIMTTVGERRRTAAAPRVIVPRPEPEHLDEFLAFYGERDCFYASRSASTAKVSVLPCADAQGPLHRPRFTTQKAGLCPRVRTYAERWGLRAEIGPSAPEKR